MKLKLKLVAVAVAALSPVVALLAYNEFAVRHARDQEVRENAAQAARQASSEVGRIIEGLEGLLIAVGAMPAVRNLDVSRCSEALASLVAKVGNIRTIFVVDPEGKAVCGSANVQGLAFGDREYFQAALATKQFVVGTYTKSRVSDAAVLPVALPVIEDDAVKAVVVTGVRLDWLEKRITERGVAPGNAVTVADAKGVILARTPFPERFVGTVIPDAYQPLIHAAEPGIMEVKSQDGTERILGYRPISLPANPLYVSAGFSKDNAFAPIRQATLISTAAISIGALLSFLTAVFVGNRFLIAPVGRISQVMQQWRNGDTGARTGMAQSDEVGAVGASLDALLDELDRRRLRNEEAELERGLLVRELGHRVKNSFALVQAIASQTFHRADPERFKSFSQRLTALASTYDLLLSKDARHSSVHDIVCRALDAHAGNGSLRISLEGPDVVLSPELALPLSLVTHELATNATKYGSLSSATGRISISWEHVENALSLRWVEADGPPVEPPTRKGFGSVLIERAFPAAANASSKADYRPEGLSFEIRFSSKLHSDAS